MWTPYREKHSETPLSPSFSYPPTEPPESQFLRSRCRQLADPSFLRASPGVVPADPAVAPSRSATVVPTKACSIPAMAQIPGCGLESPARTSSSRLPHLLFLIWVRTSPAPHPVSVGRFPPTPPASALTNPRLRPPAGHPVPPPFPPDRSPSPTSAACRPYPDPRRSSSSSRRCATPPVR